MSETNDILYDEVLVLRSQQGHANAFEELVRRWQKRLWDRAFRVTRDEAASWDIVQNTWGKVVQSLARIENPTAFPGWILRITNNLAIDWIRHEGRRRKLHETYAHNTVQDGPADGHRQLKDVYAALGQLDADTCEVVTLFYIDEMKISEIAGMLDIPMGTVKSRLHYGRTKLRNILGETP